MDFYASLFWLGFFVLLVAHVQLLRQHVQTASRQHAFVSLTGLVLMFVGSKIGREFLGMIR